MNRQANIRRSHWAEAIQACGGHPVHGVALKGRSNYLCLRRWMNESRTPSSDRRESREIATASSSPTLRTTYRQPLRRSPASIRRSPAIRRGPPSPRFRRVRRSSLVECCERRLQKNAPPADESWHPLIFPAVPGRLEGRRRIERLRLRFYLIAIASARATTPDRYR